MFWVCRFSTKFWIRPTSFRNRRTRTRRARREGRDTKTGNISVPRIREAPGFKYYLRLLSVLRHRGQLGLHCLGGVDATDIGTRLGYRTAIFGAAKLKN